MHCRLPIHSVKAHHALLLIVHGVLQGCYCTSTTTLVNVNGTVTCAPDLTSDHKKISIVLLVVVPLVVIFFIILDALGRLRRGSYDRYVLRWVKRKGAPGKQP